MIMRIYYSHNMHLLYDKAKNVSLKYSVNSYSFTVYHVRPYDICISCNYYNSLARLCGIYAITSGRRSTNIAMCRVARITWK